MIDYTYLNEAFAELKHYFPNIEWILLFAIIGWGILIWKFVSIVVPRSLLKETE